MFMIWSSGQVTKSIDNLAIQLHGEGVDLEQEHDATRFFGLYIKWNAQTGFLNMMQKDLIKPVLETLGLNIGTATGKFTPVKGKPLVKHAHGEPA